MKYKTWEVVKMLTENPELVFVRPSDGVRTMLGDKIHAGEIIGKYLKQTDGESIRLSDEWELVPRPASFMAAVKAYSEGKTIDVQHGVIHRTYTPKMFGGSVQNLLRDQNGLCIGQEEILHGEWFIK